MHRVSTRGRHRNYRTASQGTREGMNMSPEEYIEYLKRKAEVLGEIIIRLNEIAKQIEDIREQLRKWKGVNHDSKRINGLPERMSRRC